MYRLGLSDNVVYRYGHINLSNRRYLILGLGLYIFFLYIWHFHGPDSPHLSLVIDDDPSPTQDAAGLANSTALELEELLHVPVEISDFASMADRMVKFAVLAETTVAEKTVDEDVILSLFEKHFPWWLPEPSTYMPWHHRPKSDPHDTGIVICAGSRNKVYAIHLIRILRDVLHSQLPIEIAYGGDGDLSFADRHSFVALGPNIRLVNLVDHFDESVVSLQTGGYAMKPFSMLASRFRRVIMADADTIFLRAPDQVFKTEPGLVETGTFFWHDRALRPGTVERHRWIENMLGDQKPSPSLSQTAFWTDKLAEQQDSAVVCMDKGRPRVFTSLLFSVWMNLKNVRDEVTYRNTYGNVPSCSPTLALRFRLCRGISTNFNLQATKKHSGSRPNSPKHHTTSILGMPAVSAPSRPTTPFAAPKQANATIMETFSGIMVQFGTTNGKTAVNS